MIFIDFWKVIVFNFSGMENTVFFWGKKVMERWYLLITEKSLFWDTKKFCFELFNDRKYGIFLAKKLIER